MAKFGEGDDRWIVKELGEAGRNVNNWHWTEKDVTEWSKERLGQLFTGLKLVDDKTTTVAISRVESVKGEAVLNIRKAKLIPSYELELRLIWEGELRDDAGASVGTAKGKVDFPYIADENHDEEPEMRVLCDANDATSSSLKAAILAAGPKKEMLDRITKFVSELRAGGPAGDEPGDASAAAAAASKPKLSSADKAAADKAAAAASTSGSSDTRNISLKERFHCRPSDIYDCFTHEGRACAFSQSKATVQPHAGGSFSWYGGSIEGEFVELQPPGKIVMKWRFNTWEDGCFSKVELSIDEPEPGNTIVRLKQSGIPIADKYGNEGTVDITERGWQGQVFQRIRSVFGYGV